MFWVDDISMTHTLTQIGKQWISRILSLCVLGPLCAMIASGVIGADGSHHTTFLTGSSIGSGALALLMILGLSLTMGVVIGRVVDRREGLLNIALVFGWVAWTSGRLGEIYRVTPESGTLIKLGLEGLVISVGVLIALVLMTNPSKSSNSAQHDEISRFDVGYLKNSLVKREGICSLIAAMIGGLIFSLLFGQTDLPGQSVGVGFGAGIVAGTLGALLANTMRDAKSKNMPTPFAPIIIGMMLASVFAPIIGVLKPGADGLLGLLVHGDLPGYLIVSPIAWVMGALLGVPIGHSWVEHSVHQANASQPATA